MNDVKIHVCVLAAGASSRFGSPKQLQLIDNQPLVMHAYNKIEHPNVALKSLVLGAHLNSIREVIPQKVSVVIADQWKTGLSASIKTAIKAMDDKCSHLMIALADQIALSADDYYELIEMSIRESKNIIAAKYANRAGVPAIFPKSKVTMLNQLSGDKGAGGLLNASSDVDKINLPNAALDIDTPADLERFMASVRR